MVMGLTLFLAQLHQQAAAGELVEVCPTEMAAEAVAAVAIITTFFKEERLFLLAKETTAVMVFKVKTMETAQVAAVARGRSEVMAHQQ
jgi:hypothetical protein